MKRRAKTAITGWGTSELSRKPGATIVALARDAVLAAVADAGLAMCDVDGLILCQSDTLASPELTLAFRHTLDLGTLNLLVVEEGKGTTMLQAIQHASMAVETGMVRHVVCVFSDTPIRASVSAGASFARPSNIMNMPGWERRYGSFGAISAYAMAASCFLARYGLDEQAFGHYAIACRRWANDNPAAFMDTPLSMTAYLESGFVAEPLRMLDCAFPVNGAAAFVVTTGERTQDAVHRPVYLHGFGQGHGRYSALSALVLDQATGAGHASQQALDMAGLSHGDVSICELYDAFSFSGLWGLENFGFCPPGEAAFFVADGQTSPGGSLPTNTGGGHLSGYYLQGATPLLEALEQASASAGRRQVPANDIVFVSNSGGCLEYHAAAILSPHQILQ